jgi:hypothetical protein
MRHYKKFFTLITVHYLLFTVMSAHVAQSAEHILGKDEVTGSIPVMGSREILNSY